MEMEQTNKGKEYLVALSNSTSSSEQDGIKIQALMKLLGFPNCIVTCGIVYLDGHGTIENPPRSISQVAKLIIEIAEKQEQKELVK